MNAPIETTMSDERSIEREAAKWIVRMSAKTVSATEIAAFAAWRDADPRHARKYRVMMVDWRDLGELRDFVNTDVLIGPPTFQERVVAAVRSLKDALQADGLNTLAKAAMIAVLSVIIGPSVSTIHNGVTIREKTEIGETREIALDDGSTVVLGGDSRIEIHFSDTQRNVALTRGDAFFSVAKDHSRPFVVAAGETQARAVGTKFDVHRGDKETRVAVLEGIVEVTTPPVDSNAQQFTGPKEVLAGQELVAPKQDLAKAVRIVAANGISTWRSGRLDYEDVPLREVVADANRYYKGRIIIDSEGLADLRVTMSFRTDQLEEMIESLSLALHLNAERRPDRRVILKALR